MLVVNSTLDFNIGQSTLSVAIVQNIMLFAPGIFSCRTISRQSHIRE